LLGLAGVFVVWVYGVLHPGSHPFTTLTRDGLLVGGLVVGYRFLASRVSDERASDAPLPATVAPGVDALESVREQAAGAGGGAYLGVNRGSWVFADPEHGVLLLGPPRSGKTSGVVIPALLACPGACVSTSTKLDVLHATLAARQRSGEVWLFDPTGEHASSSVDGVRRLSWSPVAAAGSWDQALVMARAMTLAAPSVGRGTQHEQHWSERAGALLGPLLYAANRSGRPIADVLRWVLRHDLSEPGVVLEREGAVVACDVLEGIARTDERERSSIFSATAGVLALYNTDSARAAAARPNFDPDRFAVSTDTVFITAPAHRQPLCAPLVVGLLEQIRHATYRRAARGETGLPVFLCLDEVANIAPIPGRLPGRDRHARAAGPRRIR
jgi:type IV secretion system protein VirD4